MLLVVGAGGNGQTYFMEFLAQQKLPFALNSSTDHDGLKHFAGPPRLPMKLISNEVLTHIDKCIFLFNHPYDSLISHYRRNTIHANWSQLQCLKLGNPYRLSANTAKNYWALARLTLQNQKDLYGIEAQFNNWARSTILSYPVMFLNFKDIPSQSDTINAFLQTNIDFTAFEIKERLATTCPYRIRQMQLIYDALYQRMLKQPLFKLPDTVAAADRVLVKLSPSSSAVADPKQSPVPVLGRWPRHSRRGSRPAGRLGHMPASANNFAS